MQTYAIFRRKAWKDEAELKKSAELSSKIGAEEMADQVKWIRSYVVKHDDGSLGTICIYQGTGEEAIREHARRAELQADEVMPVTMTVVINQDPE